MSRQSKYTKELLEGAAAKSRSVAQTMRRIGLPPHGSMHGYISRLLKRYEIDTSHFSGRGWNKGGTSHSRLSAAEILVYDRSGGGRKEPRSTLKRAMLEIGFGYRCAVCDLKPIWNEQTLTLQIDHIDGDVLNNNKNNVRFLCPNCHSQTNTFGALNRTPVTPHENKLLTDFKATQSVKKKRKLKPRPKCLGCHRRVKECNRKYCSIECSSKSRRRADRPSKKLLHELVWTYPTVHIAKEFGVSDVAITKWCKQYGIDKPPRGHWATKKRAAEKRLTSLAPLPIPPRRL